MAALHRGLQRAASRLALMALEETVIGLRSHESAPRSEATMDQTTSTTPVYPQCQECHETALPRSVSLSNGTRTITYICQQCQRAWDVTDSDDQGGIPRFLRAAR